MWGVGGSRRLVLLGSQTIISIKLIYCFSVNDEWKTRHTLWGPSADLYDRHYLRSQSDWTLANSQRGLNERIWHSFSQIKEWHRRTGLPVACFAVNVNEAAKPAWIATGEFNCFDCNVFLNKYTICLSYKYSLELVLSDLFQAESARADFKFIVLKYFQTVGGGEDLPATNLTVNNVFNIEVKAAKLLLFTWNLSWNNLIWHIIVHGTSCHYGNHIWGMFFQSWNFPVF